MTYTGKLSRGCETCRKIHVKCDEKRPECSRCVRLKRVCNGYRDEVDLMFRMEYANPGSKSNRNGRPRKLESYSAPLRGIHSQPDTQHKNPRHMLPGIARSLFPSQDDQTLCYFYEFVISTMPEPDHSLYLHLQLPTLLSRSRQNSALYLAAQAISHAVWAKSRGNHPYTMQVSRKRYVQPISALKAAIQDPIEVKSDENLYAVLLLCGYETIVFDLEMLSAWGSHVDGAAALRVRGKEQLSTPLQCNMFLFIRRNAVHSHVQLSQPVDPVFHEFAGSVLSFENTEDRLLSRTIKLPQLQSLANEILSRPSWSIIKGEISKLIRAAEDLDRELVSWTKDVPVGWSYSVATKLSSISGPDLSTSYYIPSEIHGYSGFYVARVWNLYRVSRLIVQSILFRLASHLYSHPQNGRQQSENTHIEKSISVLVNDICASVPFLLGYDLSEFKRPATSINAQDDRSIWPQNSMSKAINSKHTGRFSLIWPLYLSCSVSSIPETQRWWMRAQLQWIAEHGEPLAKFVSEAQSQTLLGVPENFRFDCI
ncbi:C6 zinc finger protein [Xylogone sp. PMI_703]|nr:C6 zinc finger protein [Xylogone sp. PMI_703]